MTEEIQHKTKKPTAEEQELAAAILQDGAKKKPDREKFAKAKKLTAAALKSPRHELAHLYSCVDQLPIHYFKRIDESVTGVLGPATEEAMGRGTTYPLVLDSGRIIRLPGNRMLHKLIDKAECIGLRVTITYKGKLLYRWGNHYQKVYELTPAPLRAEAKPEPDKPKVISKNSKEDRREALKTLIGLMKGRPVGAPTLKLLREFVGEAWADKAIAKAEAAK